MAGRKRRKAKTALQKLIIMGKKEAKQRSQVVKKNLKAYKRKDFNRMLDLYG